jgi:hypothetical protein
MSFIRNVLAIIGLIGLVGLDVGYTTLAPKVSEFDPRLLKAYAEFGNKLLNTGDPGLSMMWSVGVNDDLSPEDVVQALRA